MPMKLIRWKTWRNFSFGLAGIALAVGGSIFGIMLRFPGKSHHGDLPPLTEKQKMLSPMLRSDIEHLASEIGERGVWNYDKYQQAARYIESSFREAGFSRINNQDFVSAGKVCKNLEVEIRGKTKPEEIVIIGAHYDTVPGCPGANDNSSGVAALLALAREFSGRETSRTLRFVAFANEELLASAEGEVGSVIYARHCRERGDDVTAMLSLETIGYYSSQPNSQLYPKPLNFLYPSTGNFIAFVGNVPSRYLVRRVIGAFREHAQFPSEGGAFPRIMADITRSDHAPFWDQGYPALMVTDTAPFRYAHYHTPDDTPDKIHYDHLARVVEGLEAVVDDLVNR